MTAGVYLHIPFCKSRCSYCDFATDIYRSSDAVERYVRAICEEIQQFSTEQVAADTIYFGGGTPSLLTSRQLEAILERVYQSFNITSDVEITMEMNPATVTPGSLKGYWSLGVNRASFGLQTFDDTELKRLARGHSAAEALETFRMLREAGFSNISFDLIAGLPGQSVEAWKQNLGKALALEPEHLSLYLLEIHEGTPLAEQIRSRRQPEPDEGMAAEMYEIMLDTVSAAGYKQYEISNFAKSGFESRHNTKYWILDPVYGFGVSAHSFDGRQRYANERDTSRYVEMIEKGLSPEVYRGESDTASESAFLGLRLTEGIDTVEYEKRFDIDLSEKYRKELSRFADAELIDISGGRLRLTRRGMLFSNEVFAAFV